MIHPKKNKERKQKGGTPWGEADRIGHAKPFQQGLARFDLPQLEWGLPLHLSFCFSRAEKFGMRFSGHLLTLTGFSDTMWPNKWGKGLVQHAKVRVLWDPSKNGTILSFEVVRHLLQSLSNSCWKKKGVKDLFLLRKFIVYFWDGNKQVEGKNLIHSLECAFLAQ